MHHDPYPAYISWEVYLKNQQRLQAKRLDKWQPDRDETGAARQGSALLQGIVYWGHCEHQRHTQKKGGQKYGCYAQKRMYGGERCAIVNATYLDPVVVAAFLAAVQPAQLDVLAAVRREQQEAHAPLAQQWQQQLQRVSI